MSSTQGTASYQKKERLRRRHSRVRARIEGTKECPRLSVYRSNRGVRIQIIDDEEGKTIAAVVALGSGGGGSVDAAREAGKSIAKKAKDKGVTNVVFDRGGFHYHGKVKAVAEGAREEGLLF